MALKALRVACAIERPLQVLFLCGRFWPLAVGSRSDHCGQCPSDRVSARALQSATGIERRRSTSTSRSAAPRSSGAVEHGGKAGGKTTRIGTNLSVFPYDNQCRFDSDPRLQSSTVISELIARSSAESVLTRQLVLPRPLYLAISKQEGDGYVKTIEPAIASGTLCRGAISSCRAYRIRMRGLFKEASHFLVSVLIDFRAHGQGVPARFHALSCDRFRRA